MNAVIPIVLERDNVNDETVTLVRWFVQDGDKVEVDALLAEVETSKANIEVHAPGAGYLVKQFPVGAEIPVSATIGLITAQAPTHEGAAKEVEVRKVAAPAVEPQPLPLGDTPPQPHATQPAPGIDLRDATPYPQRVSPLAERMMEQHGIPAAAFAGKSVVRKQDILDYLNPPLPSTAPQAPAARFKPAKIAQPYSEIPLPKRKRSEAANLGAGMGNAVASSVSVTCFTRGLRGILDAKLGDGNASAVFIYEVSRLLRKYPALNATYRDNTMLQYEQVNIGFAMDDGRGLKVAVLPQCDEMPLQEIAGTLRELTIAYIEDKLTPAEIANPTFTISDMSSLGVSAFLPLISENQGAILGIGGEQFAPGSEYGFYTLTLTFDHQLSDGRTAALFLNDLKFRLSPYEETAEMARPELVCTRCFRSVEELRTLNEHLLRSAESGGYLCTLCAIGW